MKDCYITNPLYPYNYERMCLCIRRLTKCYGDIIHRLSGGVSTQGRSIELLSLGKGKRLILCVGAIHGREYVSVAFLLRCMEEYAKAFCKEELFCGFDVKKILSSYTFHFVPAANPDSVEIALSRAKPCVDVEDFSSFFYKNNANNVNINANFPFEWENVPKSRQGGTCAESESETRFLTELCEKYPYEKMLSFHSRGDCIYWRDKANGKIDSDEELSEALHRVCGFSLCPETKNVKAYSGGFENWFRHKYRKPALCIELISDEDAPFDLCCRDFFRLTRFGKTKCAVLVASSV